MFNSHTPAFVLILLPGCLWPSPALRPSGQGSPSPPHCWKLLPASSVSLNGYPKTLPGQSSALGPTFLSSWCRHHRKGPLISAWEFLSLPTPPHPPADPCSLHSLSQTNVSPASSSRGSPWPLGIPVQSLSYCQEVSARLLSSPGPSLSPASFLLVPITQGSVPLSLPLSQLHCHLPRRSSMETSKQ